LSTLPGLQIVVFFLALLALGLPAAFWAASDHPSVIHAPFLVPFFMWIPGLAALFVLRLYRQPLTSLGFRFTRFRFIFFAFLCPFAICLFVYGTAWWSGNPALSISRFANDLRQPYSYGVGPSFFLFLLVQGILSLIGAAGDEIGWRGFLVPVLARRGDFPLVVWASWLAWFLYHLPLILFAGYHGQKPLGFELAFFGVMLFALSAILAWLRLASRSIWPAIFFHAAHNFLVQALFDKLTAPNSSSDWVTGEFGVGLAMGYLLVAFWVFTMGWRSSKSGVNQQDDDRSHNRE
jgi:uncharacterized protein